MKTLTVQSKLNLLQSLRKRRAVDKSAGFTLIEVVTVAALLSILFASLVPSLLGARSRAAASAVIAETIGIARACQSTISAGIGQDVQTNPSNGSAVTCDGSNPTAVSFTSRPWTGRVIPGDNIRCAGSSVTSNGEARVVVSIATDATMSCSVTAS
jgi:prepilin-type N-terminal cleavage/methylation domain-containing protein